MTGLRLTGLVDHARTVSTAEARRLPGNVTDVTAHAVGAVGGAVPVASLVDVASPQPSATHVTAISRDGSYRASIPLEVLREGGWLAHTLEDGPLPADKGGPFRLTVAEGRTLCWNVKDVGELRFTAGPEADDVPANPPH